jgi:hypothetical protein
MLLQGFHRQLELRVLFLDSYVNSLIEVSRQEGGLIELCGVLAAERDRNKAVKSAILAVRECDTPHQRPDRALSCGTVSEPGVSFKPRHSSLSQNLRRSAELWP